MAVASAPQTKFGSWMVVRGEIKLLAGKIAYQQNGASRFLGLSQAQHQTTLFRDGIPLREIREPHLLGMELSMNYCWLLALI
jgi:hypothetical protein